MRHSFIKIRDFLHNLPSGIRRILKMTMDAVTVSAAYYVSFMIRFEWHPGSYYITQFLHSLPVLLVLSLTLFFLLRGYANLWVYWSWRDLRWLAFSHSSAVLIFFIGDRLTGLFHIPNSIFIIYWVIGIWLLTIMRLASREFLTFSQYNKDKSKRLLIVGAGEAGEMLINQIHSDPKLDCDIVGLVDDDPEKQHRRIHGVKIYGGREQIPALARKLKAREIIIAVPSATTEQILAIVSRCEAARIPFRTIPGPRELIDGKVTMSRVRPVRIADLLGREQAEMNKARVGPLIEDRTVLVTGAAGSIGSELCRQIASLKPRLLVMLDKDENRLFFMEHELEDRCPVRSVVAHIGNRRRMEYVFETWRPKVVFHAAAYKHVPYMEINPEEAVLNNVEGTVLLAETAEKFRVEKFVFISSDKAVNPPNIMGATKRLCEIYFQNRTLEGASGFISVRFGNVIGSQGSVIPLFERQLKKGKPLTVTHPDVERYFMSIEEASRLVLEAASLGKGGCIFVLDMGKPIRIMDLARHMISLAGLRPDKDVRIEVTGLRPGEKMTEELWYDFEEPEPTDHPSIRVNRNHCSKLPALNGELDSLIQAARDLRIDEMVKAIQKILPEFSPSPMVVERMGKNVRGEDVRMKT